LDLDDDHDYNDRIRDDGAIHEVISQKEIL
jgi:hypothetical protein